MSLLIRLYLLVIPHFLIHGQIRILQIIGDIPLILLLLVNDLVLLAIIFQVILNGHDLYLLLDGDQMELS